MAGACLNKALGQAEWDDQGVFKDIPVFTLEKLKDLNSESFIPNAAWEPDWRGREWLCVGTDAMWTEATLYGAPEKVSAIV